MFAIIVRVLHAGDSKSGLLTFYLSCQAVLQRCIYTLQLHDQITKSNNQISKNSYLNSLLGVFIQSLSLTLENFDIGSQEVFPLHTFLPGHGPNKQSYIHILKSRILISCCHNVYKDKNRWHKRGYLDTGKYIYISTNTL